MFNIYADVDAISMTPSRNTRSYTLRSVPSSPGRSFLIFGITMISLVAACLQLCPSQLTMSTTLLKPQSIDPLQCNALSGKTEMFTNKVLKNQQSFEKVRQMWTVRQQTSPSIHPLSGKTRISTKKVEEQNKKICTHPK